MLIGVLALVVSEVVLRLFGFGQPPLYLFDPNFEYIYKPNQMVERLGHVLQTNSYSQRSPEPEKGKVKILKIGDSIINGGQHVSNKDLSSNRLMDSLNKVLNTPVQVLNISAGSWGPENGAAYLKEYGSFDAKVMIMVYSSHDYYDIPGEVSPVGINPDYPENNHWFAWSDVIEKAFHIYLGTKKIQYNTPRPDSLRKKNVGMDQLVNYGNAHGMQMLAYLHPDMAEQQDGEYGYWGKQMIAKWDSLGVPCMLGMEYMTADCYRDNIHLNELGHQKLADALFAETAKRVRQKPD